MSRRLNTRIAVWAGDRAEEVRYGGEIVKVPGLNQVSDAPTLDAAGRVVAGNPSSEFRYQSAAGADGRPIPGTILLSDISGRRPDGGMVKVFDVDDWVEGVENTSRGKGQLDRGLAFVHDVSEVAAAKQKGRPKWLKMAVKNAQELLTQELGRRAALKRANQPVGESPHAEAIREAQALLKQYGAAAGPSISDDAILETLGMSKAAVAANPDIEEFPAQHLSQHIPQPDELEPAPRSAVPEGPVGPLLFKQAVAAGLSLKKDEMAGLLADDEAVCEAVYDRIVAASATAETPVPAGA